MLFRSLPNACATVGDGFQTPIFGSTRISLSFNGHNFSVDCAVIGNLPSPIILGMDQLVKRKAMINLQQEKITLLDDNHVAATLPVSTTPTDARTDSQSGYSSSTYQVRCDDDLIIPANCTMFITACGTLRNFINEKWVTPIVSRSQLIENRAKLRLPDHEGLWVA